MRALLDDGPLVASSIRGTMRVDDAVNILARSDWLTALGSRFAIFKQSEPEQLNRRVVI